jgi:hypothetical protein
MDRREISRAVAMVIAGWKTDSIFRRYRIVDDQDLREAAAKLGGGFLSVGGKLRGRLF